MINLKTWTFWVYIIISATNPENQLNLFENGPLQCFFPLAFEVWVLTEFEPDISFIAWTHVPTIKSLGVRSNTISNPCNLNEARHYFRRNTRQKNKSHFDFWKWKGVLKENKCLKKECRGIWIFHGLSKTHTILED